MSTAIEKLTDWFDNLPSSDQKDVIRFLYGGKILLQEGLYVGPHPGAVYKGLHCGPVPSSGANVCPTCGKPF